MQVREVMTVGTAAARVRSSITTLGLAHTLHDLTLRAANRAFVVKILKGMTAERINPAFLTCPAPYRPTFLDAKALREFGRDSANGLPEGFLEEALAKGDECF